MNEFLAGAQRVLSLELLKIGKASITLSTLLTIALVVVATFWLSKILRRLATRVLTRSGDRPGLVGTVTPLIHYGVLITGLGAALDIAGIDLSALFAAGAIFAVGLGFALQNIVQNFVSGIILITERAIKPGDVVEVEGKVVRVVELGIRSSIARSRDGEELIVPNSALIQTTVKNFTLLDSTYRIRAAVGVVYAADMKAVRQTLERVAEEVSKEWAVPNQRPQVIMTGFGDNAVQWEVAIWMDNPWEARRAQSDLHEALWFALKDAGIVIAFPQLDLHLDPPVLESLRALGAARAA